MRRYAPIRVGITGRVRRPQHCARTSRVAARNQVFGSSAGTASSSIGLFTNGREPKTDPVSRPNRSRRSRRCWATASIRWRLASPDPSAAFRPLMWAWIYSGVLLIMDLSLVVLLCEVNVSIGPCDVIGAVA